jgi:transposase
MAAVPTFNDLCVHHYHCVGNARKIKGRTWSTTEMSEDLQELKKELQRLREQRVIDAKAEKKARDRASGRQIDPSNRSFAASQSEDLKKLDRRIAEIEAKIEKAER